MWDVSLSPRGHYFVSVGADQTARLWSTERKGSLRIFLGHQSDVECVTWHPNSHYFITGSNDFSLRLWDVASGYCVRILSGLHSPITSVSICPDGKSVIAGSQGGQIIFWDLGEARILGELYGYSKSVWSLVFSGDFPFMLATGGEDGIVKIWDYKAFVSSVSGQSIPESLVVWITNQTPIITLRFTTTNLLIGAGAIRLNRFYKS